MIPIYSKLVWNYFIVKYLYLFCNRMNGGSYINRLESNKIKFAVLQSYSCLCDLISTNKMERSFFI